MLTLRIEIWSTYCIGFLYESACFRRFCVGLNFLRRIEETFRSNARDYRLRLSLGRGGVKLRARNCAAAVVDELVRTSGEKVEASAHPPTPSRSTLLSNMPAMLVL